MRDALYHWSPRSRRKQILKLGLMPGRRNILGPELNSDGTEWRQPWVCTSPDPATAWAYTHDGWGVDEIFDLWQFWTEPDDVVKVQAPEHGRVLEVRIGNRIRKSRLHWVGERQAGGRQQCGRFVHVVRRSRPSPIVA